MKKIAILTLLLITTLNVTCQDKIITGDGQVINANILNISGAKIDYKLSDYEQSPLLASRLKDIVEIHYQDGKIVPGGYNNPSVSLL